MGDYGGLSNLSTREIAFALMDAVATIDPEQVLHELVVPWEDVFVSGRERFPNADYGELIIGMIGGPRCSNESVVVVHAYGQKSTQHVV